MTGLSTHYLERLAACPDGADEEMSLAAFVALVLRDEETGDPVEIQPYHVDLIHSLVTYKDLVVTAHVESGKTQIGAMWVLWMLGRNPRLRIAVLSESSSLATDIVGLCARYIDDSSFDGCRALQRIFPDLTRSRKPGDKWSPSEGVITVSRPGGVKDPSIKAFGADQGITGRRVDIALLDDYVTPKTTETPYLRAQQATMFFQRVYGRVVMTGRRVFFNNAQWEDDCAAQFARKPGVHEHLMPVTTTGDVSGESEWDHRWPKSRIKEFAEQNPDAPAQLFCRRRKVGQHGRFSEVALKSALDKGRGLGWPYIPEVPVPSSVVCIGVDFAFTKSKKSDRSAFVAVLREKPREHRKVGRRTVMDVRAGKWDEAEALEHFDEFVRQFTRRGYRVRIRAESNQAQNWIVQRWASVTGAMIEPYTTTGKKKWDPVTGVPGLAASFALGQYVVPSDDFGCAIGTCDELMGDLKAFDPSPKSHTGDLVMGLFFAEGVAQDVANHEYIAYSAMDDVPPSQYPDEQAEAVVTEITKAKTEKKSIEQLAAEAQQQAAELREREERDRKRRDGEELVKLIEGGDAQSEALWDSIRAGLGL